jgi:hypothetical protein
MALLNAVDQGNVDMTKLLLDHGASPSTKFEVRIGLIPPSWRLCSLNLFTENPFYKYDGKMFGLGRIELATESDQC